MFTGIPKSYLDYQDARRWVFLARVCEVHFSILRQILLHFNLFIHSSRLHWFSSLQWSLLPDRKSNYYLRHNRRCLFWHLFWGCIRYFEEKISTLTGRSAFSTLFLPCQNVFFRSVDIPNSHIEDLTQTSVTKDICRRSNSTTWESSVSQDCSLEGNFEVSVGNLSEIQWNQIKSFLELHHHNWSLIELNWFFWENNI